MQLLLQDRRGSIPTIDRSRFISLQSHLDNFRRLDSGDVKKTDKWHDTMMMSKAALEFSGMDKDLESVLDMTTRVSQ